MKDRCSHLVHLEISSVAKRARPVPTRKLRQSIKTASQGWGVLLFLRTFSQKPAAQSRENGGKSQLLTGISLAL